jgi:hypothetical protein
MNRTVTRDLDVPASAVIATLHDLERLGAWMSGLLDHRVEPRPDGTADVVLRLRAPRTLDLRLEVTRLPEGLHYALVEGDPTNAEGRLVVTSTGTGCRVVWTHELAFPVAVPGLLVRELDDEVLPRWLSALGKASSE